MTSPQAHGRPPVGFSRKWNVRFPQRVACEFQGRAAFGAASIRWRRKSSLRRELLTKTTSCRLYFRVFPKCRQYTAFELSRLQQPARPPSGFDNRRLAVHIVLGITLNIT